MFNGRLWNTETETPVSTLDGEVLMEEGGEGLRKLECPCLMVMGRGRGRKGG